MGILTLAESTRADLDGMVCKGYPLETCGLLVGQKKNGRVEINWATQARNLNRERAKDRYELDPRDFLTTDEQARAAGLEIVGVWHSHPDHPAQPSETDRAAAWEGWSYMILSVTQKGLVDIRSWRLNSEQFVEESIELCPR